jgi:hypothetical protein
MGKVLLALAVGAVSIFAQAAFAADVGTPVYAPPPEPPFSWAGFYLVPRVIRTEGTAF